MTRIYFVRHARPDFSIHDDLTRPLADKGIIEDFDSFVKEQWNNFDYKLSRGESLNEVQKRNTDALYEIVRENTDRNIVIGTHGTALSTLINYYNKDFGYSDFERIKHLMPFIVCVEFQGKEFKTMKEFSL